MNWFVRIFVCSWRSHRVTRDYVRNTTILTKPYCVWCHKEFTNEDLDKMGLM